ncbi:2,3-bisphosphoglycerate-independent phosphoglycerate mutase [Mycoplasma suis]|nr:2,3-bisphosphoglycerate-independent phosphoglycerate mutase [Mycoplasma suis]
MDGWGLREEKEWNAIANANTPNFDSLRENFPSTSLTASGELVGLPPSQMGNSEVGHLNIGAGRIVETGLYRINQSIKRGEFPKIPAIQELLKDLNGNIKSNLHVFILASKGGVHSHLDHLYEFLRVANSYGIKSFVHLFSDGRDVAPSQFLVDLEEILPKLKETNSLLATISGRYFAMDRDKNWDRLEKVLRVMTLQTEIDRFENPKEYVSSQYEKGITDEFISPAASKEFISSESGLKEGDQVVFLNFRPDRAKQLSHVLVGSKGLYSHESELVPKNLSLHSISEYEGISSTSVFFPSLELKNTLGEVINSASKSQLRAAESEKYPHVTYFFDGGVEKEFSNIQKIIVPSPKVGTYDKAPAMSIEELCTSIEEAVLEKKHDLVVINFANPDMVGHSGDFEATVKACEAVDRALGRIYELSKKTGHTLLIMADHGNADIMRDEKGLPHTAHTLSPVPFIVCDSSYQLKKEGGKLGDIAPTILEILDLEQPKEMTGSSLLI